MPSSWYLPFGLFFFVAYSLVSYNALWSAVLVLAGSVRLYYFYYRSQKITAVEGRGVLITGCAQGFGYRTAVDLHAMGFTVFACCLNDQSDGAKKLKSLGSETGRLHVLKMDVTNQKEIDEGLVYVQDHLPELGLWGLVSNAGRSHVGFLEWLPFEVFEKLTTVNLFGAIRVTKTFLPLIRRSQGRIVFVTSLLGRVSTPWFGAYCITKHGLESFTDTLRVELHQFGVKVSIVEPGNYMNATGIMGHDEGSTLMARQFWDQLPESIQLDYGKEKWENWLVKRMKAIMKDSSDDISPVTNAMADAIYRLHPKDRYFEASLTDRILAYIFQFTPTYLSDLLNHYFSEV